MPADRQQTAMRWQGFWPMQSMQDASSSTWPKATASRAFPTTTRSFWGKRLPLSGTRSGSPRSSASLRLGRWQGEPCPHHRCASCHDLCLRRRQPEAPQDRPIDLYGQHRQDPEVPVEEVAGVMAELISEGKILLWGALGGRFRDDMLRRCRLPCRCHPGPLFDDGGRMRMSSGSARSSEQAVSPAARL